MKTISSLNPYLRIFSVLICLLLAGEITAQDQKKDSLQLLKAVRVNISVNNYDLNPELGSFDDFRNDFKFGNKFITTTLPGFELDTFQSNSRYSGFMVNFIFRSDLFNKKAEHDREFFTAAFETGQTIVELYRLRSADIPGIQYEFISDIFRITLGYRRILTKKDKRLKFYVGLEYVSEFNISGAIFENQYDQDFNNLTGERKLFAKKSYNPYLNIPFGLDWRLFKKASMFFHGNIAVGSQNADPFRLNGIYGGTRFGFSLKI